MTETQNHDPICYCKILHVKYCTYRLQTGHTGGNGYTNKLSNVKWIEYEGYISNLGKGQSLMKYICLVFGVVINILTGPCLCNTEEMVFTTAGASSSIF